VLPYYFIGNSYEEEVEYLKVWLTERMNWINANIIPAEGNYGDASKADILIFPNPLSDRMNLYVYSTGFEKVRIESQRAHPPLLAVGLASIKIRKYQIGIEDSSQLAARNLQLFDLLGQKVLYREVVPGGSGLQYIDLDISAVRSGYYVLRAAQGKNQFGKKKILVSGR
jgi:hypothetical protein